ncbi:MAG: hypothetical protein ACRYGG_02065 [Janthinobacterium lividum]
MFTAREGCRLLLLILESCNRHLLTTKKTAFPYDLGKYDKKDSWVVMLIAAVNDYLNINETDQSRGRYRKLLRLGIRKHQFVCKEALPTIFGMSLSDVLNISSTRDCGLKLIRDLVGRIQRPTASLVVQVRFGSGDRDFFLASASPSVYGQNQYGHTAWVLSTGNRPSDSLLGQIASNVEDIVTDDYVGRASNTFVWRNPPACFAAPGSTDERRRNDTGPSTRRHQPIKLENGLTFKLISQTGNDATTLFAPRLRIYMHVDRSHGINISSL